MLNYRFIHEQRKIRVVAIVATIIGTKYAPILIYIFIIILSLHDDYLKKKIGGSIVFEFFVQDRIFPKK